MLDDSLKVGDTPADVAKNVDKAVKTFQAMIKAHKDVMPEIGKEGKTVEDVKKQLGQAMMKAMFSNMPAPMPTPPTLPTPTN